MWEIRLRIPSPKTLCVLYVMVNLIKVKRSSIAVAVALTVLFCVRIKVSKAKYVWTHTQRYHPEQFQSPASNHVKGLTLTI